MRLVLLDVAVPIMVGFWPLSWLALAPVIFVEWLVVRHRPALTGAPVGKAVTWANVASSIVGMPIACIAWIILGNAIRDRFFSYPNSLSSADPLSVVLTGGYMPKSLYSHPWIVALSVCALLVPCFFVSVLVEHWVCRAFWRRITPRETLRAVWKMNLASYTFLVVVVAGLTVTSAVQW